MKLFQQLLVAPAALGLLAPMAANAADLNVNGVSDYSASSEEVKSISQFSDVYPTDWAYQALTKLAQRHGCTAASPSGSMTRYEAAALLNSCLGNVAQVNDEERRLINEFGPELAVIKGRVDSLESRMGEFEAGVFSTTTKLSGVTTFVVGATDESGQEATTFNYDTKISLDTSFTGRDFLKTRIRTSNFSASDNFTSVAALEVAATNYDDTLKVDRSYYQFPIGDDITATVGAKVRQDDLLAVWPSSYPTESILDVLTYAGANSAYNLSEGAGAGITYTKDSWTGSLSFVAADGADSSKGILAENAKDDVTAQLAWTGTEGLTVAAAYTLSDSGGKNGTQSEDYSAVGVSVDWSPGADAAFIPSNISAGMGWKTMDDDALDSLTDAEDIEDDETWSIGLQWNDVGSDGNTLGFGIGSAEGWRDDSGYDDPVAYEVWYQMVVSDNITVTPSYFVIQRDGDSNDDVAGGLIKTTFRF